MKKVKNFMKNWFIQLSGRKTAFNWFIHVGTMMSRTETNSIGINQTHNIPFVFQG